MPLFNKVTYRIFTILPAVVILSLLPVVSVARIPAGVDNDLTEEFIRQLKRNHNEELLSRKIELQRATLLERLSEDFILRGFDVMNDTISIFTVFDEDLSYLSLDPMREVLDEVFAAAVKFKNKRLELLGDYFKGKLYNIYDFEGKMERLEEVVRQARRRGDNEMEALALMEMWHNSYYTERYHRSFLYAGQLAGVLDRVDDTYPYKGTGYIWIGVAYHHFKDYRQSYGYLHKGLSFRRDNQLLFASGQYLRAWDHLASYHQIHGDLDSAAWYNRLKISSPEAGVDSPDHLTFAICKLGKIEVQRGNPGAGVRMMEVGLSYMRGDASDGEFKAGVHAALAEYYISQGDVAKARAHLEDAYISIADFYEMNTICRMRDIYAAESKYYALLGQPAEASRYVDSVRVMASRYERISGQHMILLADQELQQVEVELHKERILWQRSIILLAAILMIVLTTALGVILFLYRRRQAAYRALAGKARAWADSGAALKGSGGYGVPISGVAGKESTDTGLQTFTGRDPVPDEEVKALGIRLQDYMAEYKPHTDPQLTLDSLAELMGINRNRLSEIINRAMGKNFKQYINELRVSEAIFLMNRSRAEQLSMEHLMEQAGFSGRSTFYNSFKAVTGLTPAQYWKNNQPEPLPNEEV